MGNILASIRQKRAVHAVDSSVKVFQKHKVGYSRVDGVVGNVSNLKKRELKEIALASNTMNKYKAGYYPKNLKKSIDSNSFKGTANHYTPMKSNDYAFCQEKTKHLYDTSIYNTAPMEFITRTIFNTKIQASPDNKILGITIEEKQKLSSQIESIFRLDRDLKEWDYTEQNNLSQLADIALKDYLILGEFFAIQRQEPNLSTGVSVQLLSPFQIRTPYFTSGYSIAYYAMQENCSMLINASAYNKVMANGHYIVNGIEYDKRGREFAIFIAPSNKSNIWTRLLVKNRNGFNQVIHGFIQSEVGQTRGLSMAVKSWHEYMNISDLEKFELESAKINATIAGTVTSDSNAQDNGTRPFDDLGSLSETGAGWGMTAESTISELQPFEDPSYTVREIPGGGFIVQGLTPGYKYNANDTSRPNVNIPTFINHILQYAYPSQGVSISCARITFSGSYNASKGEIDITWKNGIEYTLQQFKSDFYNPIYSTWFLGKVASGEISAPNYFEKRKAYEYFNLITPKKPSLNPLNEIKAEDLKVLLGATTRDKVSQEINGTSFSENSERLIFENDIMKKVNLDNEKESNNEGNNNE